MRKGTYAKLSLAWAFALCTLILGYGAAGAAALEPTDSGAPSAIVIFPVSAKPDAAGAGMPPVAFNHLIHEKWMTKANKDCMVCHHTGDAIACTQCHTVEGKAEGKFVTLHQAMHAPVIQPREADTPSSCVSCHENATKRRDCAGCHAQFVKNARSNGKWCAVCHTITPAMTKAQMAEGAANKLSDTANEKLAEETALARPQTRYWSPMTGPYKVTIDTLADGRYGPNEFNHRHHVYSLMDRIKDNQLAGAFHVNPATLCVTCHHNSPASTTPPKCSACHVKKYDKENPAVPNLKAAFHLLCMGCHTDMKVARPRNTDCQTCHKLNVKPAATTE